ncbi:hypothetical protein [Spirosoma aerophilum]
MSLSTYKFLTIVLLASLTGCVTIQSNIKSDAVPTFQRVLIVTKMRNAPDSYVRTYASSFPAGYEVCTLAISPLSFDNPDDAIRKQTEACHSDVILTLELVKSGHYVYRGASRPYEFNAEMTSVATGQPFWKAIIASDQNYGEQVPARSVIKRLLSDHIIEGKLPQAVN